MKSSGNKVKEILERADKKEIRALFAFDRNDSQQKVLLKFNIWVRYFFPGHFTDDQGNVVRSSSYHAQMDEYNYQIYRGMDLDGTEKKYFVNIMHRGGAKTTRTKLWKAFVISNDLDHTKRYFKVLTKDIKNATQLVTDIYNMFMNKAFQYFYPEMFVKTDLKKEERMDSFTTSFGVKMRAGVVGTDQRGQQQGSEETTRPDDIWFDDFETRKTLRSAVETEMIWQNMEEARTGLSKNGSATYTCNYLSERGNVHKLVQKKGQDRILFIVPIKKDGKPTWPEAYTMEQINNIEKNADDFHGEYMCEPSAGFDIMFDRASIKRQERKEPWRVIADFKIFHQYDPSHRYASGHDVAGGVGLDSSASVFWDFSTTPSRVVATFKSNTIKPDTFGDEIESEANRFGRPLVAVENNKFDMCIGRLKHLGYDNMYFQEMKASKVGIPPKTKTLGWNTNADTKPKMIFALKKAVEDGHAELSDPDLIDEFTSYTRDDLMDGEIDPRLSTRHFDLLMACAIGYQMKDYATFSKENEEGYQQGQYESPLNDD